MKTKTIINPTFESKLLLATGESKDLNAKVEKAEDGSARITIPDSQNLACSFKKMAEALERDFGLASASGRLICSYPRAGSVDWVFQFPPPRKTGVGALVEWLRQNSSGRYRKSAEAADLIEQLIAQKHQLLGQRHTLAKLACEEPRFYNPMEALAAKELRNNVLKNPNAQSNT